MCNVQATARRYGSREAEETIVKAANRGKLESWLHLCDQPAFGPSAERWVQQRPWFLAFVVGMNLFVMEQAGLSQLRVLALLGIIALPFSVAVTSAIVPRMRRLTPATLWLWMASGSVFITSALAVTGGMRSPLLPMMVVPVITNVAVWGWSLPARILAGNFTISVIILSSLPPVVTGTPIASPYFEVLIALNLLVGVAFGCQTVLGLSEGFTSKSRVLDSVREQALESAAGRVRSLEQVGAKVAHELKNPLAAIKSLLQLEQSGARDERSQRRLDVMTREVARMEGILREYLSFSRPLEDLRLGAVDLAVVADNVLALLEGRAASTGVRLSRTGASVLLSGDGRRLEEAVLNLTANALEATPKGGSVTVEVSATKVGGILRVCDTGMGMSPAVLDKVGTPFFTTRKEGNGLGVVLARGVITQHGGQLEFTSRPGTGTTATVTLPGTLPKCAAAIALLPGKVHGPHFIG
jgi:signal transduction histidine kinase